MTASKRKRGFYWVLQGYSFGPTWQVAEWDGRDWLYTREGCDNEPEKVGPRVSPPSEAASPENLGVSQDEPEHFRRASTALSVGGGGGSSNASRAATGPQPHVAPEAEPSAPRSYDASANGGE